MAPSRAGSPIPPEVSDELGRVVGRGHPLPLDHALARMPSVAALVLALADAVAEERGSDPQQVPDLGPAVVMDQLTVLVWDACAAGLGADLEARLATLRGTL